MKFKSVISFFNGLFETRGNEARIDENYLVKQHNFDITPTGSLKRRRGYEKWNDLEDVISSFSGIPNRFGFNSKIQSIYSFTDYEGNNYILVVSNGKIYIQRYIKAEDKKIWECINPSGTQNISDVLRRIEITSYLDTIFINDLDKNIFIYNPLNIGTSGFSSITKKYIYFANRSIYFRENIDFSASQFAHAIKDTDTANDYFIIANDYTHLFKSGNIITISGTTDGLGNSNDGTYTLIGDSTYDAGSDETSIPVTLVSYDTADSGTISVHYRIFIEDGHTQNIEGSEIGASLEAIDFYGGGKVITDFDDLNLGFAIRIGNETDGYRFFVLENQTYARTDDVYLIKMDDRFIAKDFIKYNTSQPGHEFEIFQIGYWDNKIFVFCKDGEINVTGTSTLLNTVIDGTDIQYAVAPETDSGAKKSFAVFAINNSFFLYSNFINLENFPTPPVIRDIDEGFTFKRIPIINYPNAKNAFCSNVYGHSDGNYYAVDYFFTEQDSKIIFKKISSVSNPYDTITNLQVLALDAIDNNNNIIPKINILTSEEIIYISCLEDAILLYDPSTDTLTPTDIDSGGLHAVDFCSTINQVSDDVVAICYGGSGEGIRLVNLTTAEKSWISLSVNISKLYYYDHWIYYIGKTSDDGKYLFGQINADTYDETLNTIIPSGATDIIHNTENNFWIAFPQENKIIKYGPSLEQISEVAVDNAPFSFTYDSTNKLLYVNCIRDITNIPPFAEDEAERGLFFDRDTSYGSVITIIKCDTSSYDATNDFILGHILLPEYVNSINFTQYGEIFISMWKNLGLTSHLILDPNFPYVSLNRFDHDGNFYVGNEGIEIYLFGDQGKLNNVQQFSIDNDEFLYAGITHTDSNEKGIYCKIPLNDFFSGVTEIQSTSGPDNIFKIENTRFWTMKHEEIRPSSTYIRIGLNWSWLTGFYEYGDYYGLEDNDSNLITHTYKQAIIRQEENTVDQIRPLGTPKSPYISIGLNDIAGTELFYAGMMFKYYISLLFYDGSNSMLSKETEELIIPQLKSNLVVTLVDPVNDELTITTHGLEDDDIINISSDGTLPLPFLANIDYWVIKVDANKIQLTDSEGGSAIDIGDAGSGTITVIQINKQPIKIIIKEINLLDENGLAIYENDQVQKIQLYRSQKNRGALEWTAPLLRAEFGLDEDTGDWYYTSSFPPAPPYDFPAETFMDNDRELTYNPFTSGNVLRYLAKNIIVHKNRLLLVNNLGLNTKDSNLINYSAVNNAQAIPPENIRSIQSGDSDVLISAISVGDYCYFFKNNKIYAVLGDIEDGQLVDIASSVGCPYKNMVVSYDNRVVYFLNQYGIFGIENAQVVNLDQQKINNYFDPNDLEAIDFTILQDSGFTYLDLKNREVNFYVPLKNGNLIVIIYEIDYKRFKTYSFAHDIFVEKSVKDIKTGDVKTLKGTTDGTIYEVSANMNDASVAIPYLMRTKQFNITSNFINKKFNILKVFGKFLNSLRITYWLDGQRYRGILAFRKSLEGKGEGTVFITSNGMNNTIAVEVSGEDTSQPPIEIDEILIGYEELRGIFK